MGVHHELRLHAIAMQLGESSSALRQLFGLIIEAQRLLLQAKLLLSQAARLMVHHFLRLPPIRQDGIEPDLAQLQRRVSALGLLGAILRVHPRDDGLMDRVNFRACLGVGREPTRKLFAASEHGHAQPDAIVPRAVRMRSDRLLPDLAQRDPPLEIKAVEKDNRMRSEFRSPSLELGARDRGRIAIVEQQDIHRAVGEISRQRLGIARPKSSARILLRQQRAATRRRPPPSPLRARAEW